MNKDQARKLIQDTFQGEFDKDHLIIFLKNAFHTTDFAKTFSYHGQYIKDSFKEFIKSYERVGQYTDGDGKVLDMLIVYLQKETSLVRARTAQRNFVARYLKDRGEKDAALVAFVAPDPADWRFSFVKMEYTFEQTDKGSFKAKEDFTPAKRYSFLVGEHENSHTAQRQLVSLLSQDVNQPSFKDIEEVFNIEKVSQEFFERYRELYLQIKESLDVNVDSDHRIKEDFVRCGVDTVDFAKKLLGQIVFLYFLQKKGWFGADKGEPWGTGHKDFLRRLFNKEIVDYKNFFNDVLEPLFYEALATDRGQDAYWDKFQCRIPFLNGGLFEPLNGYSWQTTDILLDNELFSNKTKTKQGDSGTGVLDVFDRFNFTVKEDEPLEKEVAVDPEMLGKVFENLLGVKDRKSKGAYYTPRQIVHYMCQESLINYLATECGEKVNREELEEFIRHGEMNIEHEARIIKEGKETRDYRHAIGETIRANAVEIDQKLADVRVCDPAVGSGAFLVGMMNEIFRARNILTNYLSTKRDRTYYDFKRQAIGHSLYGVDIDPGAVEIAKLRLWLSLVVDEEDTDDIKPLPNLDYKIMQGNSLLEEFESIKLFDESLIEDALDNHQHIERLKNEKEALQQDFLKSHNQNKLTKDRRVQLEAQIKDLIRKISKLSKVETADDEDGDLFKAKGEAKERRAELQSLYDEFPSAVSKTRKEQLKKRIEELEWDLIETTLKEQNKEDALERVLQHKKANIKPFFLWKLHFGEVFKEKGGFDVVIGNPPWGSDLKKKEKEVLKTVYSDVDSSTPNSFAYFIGLIFKISKGNSAYILPDSILIKDFAKTRKLVAPYLSNVDWFQNVGVPDRMKPFLNVDHDVSVLIMKDITSDALKCSTTFYMPSDKIFSKKEWVLPKLKIIRQEFNHIINLAIEEYDLRILDKLLRLDPLSEYLQCHEGIHTGNSRQILFKNERTNKFCKPLFHGGRAGDVIRNYSSRRSGWYVEYRKSLIDKNEGQYASLRDEKIFKFPKIYVTRTGNPFKAFLDQENYASNNFFSVQLKEYSQNTIDELSIYMPFILSSLAQYFVRKFAAPRLGCIFIETKILHLLKVRIPNLTENNRKHLRLKVKELMNELENNSCNDVTKLEKEIDEYVLDLYDLTEEEKKIVRNG